jgi:hypothetical protein
MAVYEIPFSLTAISANDKTAVRITCNNATVKIREVFLTDEYATSSERAISFRVTRSASSTGGTGTSHTPNVRDNAAAPQFSATINFSAEPSYTTSTVQSNYLAVPAGAAVSKRYEGDETVKAWGTQVLAVLVKAAADRTIPITGYVLVEE